MNSAYNFWNKHIRIDKFIFPDERKINFIDFCKDNNAEYISDINVDLLKKYSDEPGVGSGRIIELKKELDMILKRLFEQQNHLKIMDSPLEKLIFDIKNLKGITIGNFLNFNEEDLKNLNLNFRELERIYEVCAGTLPLKEILKQIEITLSEDDFQLLIDRFKNNKTLEEIGLSRNISRERIRQIEIKLKQVVINIFKSGNLNVSLKIESNFKDELSLEEMKNLFGEKYDFLVIFLMKNEIFSRPYYIDFLELFLFDKRELFFKIFYSLEFTNILTTENVKEIRNNFKNFKWIEQDEIEKIITKLGYEKHGKYYILNSGYKDILELYFVKLLQTPIRIDEQSVKEIINDINTRLDYNLYSDELENADENTALNLARRLEGLISRIDGIIMTDSRTYIHINKLEYNVEEFLKLKDEVVSFNAQYIDSIVVYKTLEEQLNNIGIKSDYIFYSLFKYHFALELNLNTNGNSRVLTIGTQEFNRVEELEKFIEKEGKVLEKSYIQEKLNYSNISLNNAIDNSENIICFDRAFIGTIDLVEIKENEKKLFKNLVLENDLDGNVSIPQLISRLKLNKNFRNFIKKNNINKYFIASLVRHFFPEYKGGCNLLTNREIEKKTH